jgi:hypothetical protein
MVYSHMKTIMKRDFPNYKRIQIGATLTEIEVVQKKLITRYKVFGIKVKSVYSYNKKIIPLVEFTIVFSLLSGICQRNRNQIYVAVDESNKTVYWNYASLPDKY